MRIWFLFLLILPYILTGEPLEPSPPHKSPEQIQEELVQAEQRFRHAQQMFNPWYAGPLLTGSASMMPPGQANIQPYLFVTDNYATFNGNHHSESIPDLVNFNPVFIVQTGITNWLDTVLTIQGDVNWQSGQSAGGFGDTTLQLGFLILRQGLYIPGIKLYLNETFPTGRYQKLSATKSGLEATGGGAFQTSATLNTAKIILWNTLHPMSLRLSLSYYVSAPLHVKGFNNYGGGYGTSGTVYPGNTFKASLGTEVSLTQNWVFANDVVYQTSNRTRFSGTAGTTGPNGTGSTASVGSGSSDSLSLAPAIEYNFSANLGLLGGVWFTVYGRNTHNFVSGILSVTYTFGG